MNKNEIIIKKCNGILVESGTHKNVVLATMLNAEVMQFGYMMTTKLLDTIATLKEDKIEKLYNSILSILKDIKGGDVIYGPMYRNFPQQVIEMSEVELYTNAFVHYLSGGQWKPDYNEKPRGIAFEHVNYKILDLVTNEEYKEVFTKILSSKDSISSGDKAIVEWFIKHHPDINIPDIPFKENLCMLAVAQLEKGEDISNMLKTATDVLRVITYMNDGDISLATNTRFKSMRRSRRRVFVNILMNVANEEDFARHRNKWGKLLHNLHVGDYSKKIYDMAVNLRANKRIVTFNSSVEEAIKNKDDAAAVKLLSQRPGEFARRFDHLIRSSTNAAHIYEAFIKVIPKIPSRILLQLWGHLNTRDVEVTKRIVFPKGNTQRAYRLEDPIPALNEDIRTNIISAIKYRLKSDFINKETLGKVWIDEVLKDCPIPTGQRSVSESAFTVARGTRLPFGDKSTLRFFIYWVGQDIDLSASFHDENFEMINEVSYTNLRSAEIKACHSGDITSAPNGASEFIDIDIAGALKHDVRYVVMNVYVYAGPTFKEHEKCYAGWMTRDAVQSNEIFDPKTVEQKADLVSDAMNSIPAIFDLVERKVIWVDLTSSSRVYHGGNNLHSNKATIGEVLSSMADLKNKISLYDLYTLHAESRGELVAEKEDADTVYSLTEGVTPYHINEINSEYY